MGYTFEGCESVDDLTQIQLAFLFYVNEAYDDMKEPDDSDLPNF